MRCAENPEKRVLQTALPKANRGLPKRAEVVPVSPMLHEGMFPSFHADYSYNFKITLLEGYADTGIGDALAQWHGVPNRPVPR